jgi:hypothetical protein
MKGGIFALSETFLKILSTASVGIVLLAIFFTINQYNLIYMENRVDRETLIVGDAVLSSCIAESSNGYPIKGLLSEEKIRNNRNMDCLNYDKAIYIEIYSDTLLLYGIGNPAACSRINPCQKRSSSTSTIFPAALNQTTKIIPVSVTIYLGV